MDQRPLSTALAVSELKRYLSDATHRIRLHDLVMNQVEQLCEAVTPDELPTAGQMPTALTLAQRMRIYETASAGSIALLAYGGFFGDTDQHDELWVRAVARVANRRLDQGGYVAWGELQQYPTLLLLYASGLGALAGRRPIALARVLSRISVRDPNGVRPVGVAAASWTALNHGLCNQLPGFERRHTPISDYLFALLREPFSTVLPDDDDYSSTFDDLEYLLGLVYADWRGDGIGPIGRFAWRRTTDSPGTSVLRYRDAWLMGVHRPTDSIREAVAEPPAGQHSVRQGLEPYF